MLMSGGSNPDERVSSILRGRDKNQAGRHADRTRRRSSHFFASHKSSSQYPAKVSLTLYVGVLIRCYNTFPSKFLKHIIVSQKLNSISGQSKLNYNFNSPSGSVFTYLITRYLNISSSNKSLNQNKA